MSFRRLAWLFPAAYLVHVLEEAPGFTEWARRNASTRYSQREFIRINTLGFVSSLAATAAVTGRRSRPLDLTYYTVVVTQQALFNAVFHSTTAVAFREYSPGLFTSILMVPLWRGLTHEALSEGRLSKRDVAVCTLVAGAFHAAVVARQVFFVGVPQKR